MVADRQYIPSSAEHGQRFVEIYCKGCTQYQAGACPILADSYKPGGTPHWRITVESALTSCTGFIPEMTSRPGKGTAELL